MSPRLVLQFLGLPQILLDNQPIVTDRRKAIALLAYLVMNDIGHPRQNYSRESLSALFWPDYDQSKAFSNLRRTIWEVHQAIGEDWLVAERELLYLNQDTVVELDVARFLDLLSQSCEQTNIALRIPLLFETVKLYRNHFLTGFSLKDADPFNEWAFAESEELKNKFTEALTLLTDSYCALNQARDAIPHARRLVAVDPLNEGSHRKLMDVYIQAGQHSEALKQYQTCEQILRKELNLDPQPETRALYKRIRKGDIKPVQAIKSAEPITFEHNLPLQISSFIGRKKEIDGVKNLISKNRLVTLVGTGGIGKTSLSLQVGYALLNEYPDGVWFIALDSLSNSDLVPQTVAAAFDIRETPDRPVIEILTNVLREKNTLLILDNCEHLLDACSQISATLLTHCPNLKILATSREVLNITGEATYQLPSLSIPEQSEASLERLTDYESVRLFTERASLTLSSFVLATDNAQTVIDICHKVDGIPLAIELAAARVNILQVAEILDQLQNSFALLSTDKSMAWSRHQTMLASLDWSWKLLNAAEQTFMRQLAVFAGGWTLEAVQMVCDGDVLGLTSALVKKSLIAVDQEAGRETRYRFHEMIRQYAHEKLVEAGEEDNIRTQHLKYFLTFSEQADYAVRGPTQLEWDTRLNNERDNIRAALKWALKTDIEAGLYLSGRLWFFWESFNIPEGAHWLAEFTKTGQANSYPRAKAKALFAYVRILELLQHTDQARRMAEECVELSKACNDQLGEIDGLLAWGDITNSPKQLAANLARQAFIKSQAINDTWRQALALGVWGWDRRDPEQVRARWEKSTDLFREVGDSIYLVSYLCYLAQFEITMGYLDSAKKRLDEAVLLSQQINRKRTKLTVLHVSGNLASIMGDYDQARTNLQKGLTLGEELGERMESLWCRAKLGDLAVNQGNLVEARQLLVQSTKEFQADGTVVGVVFTLERLASLYVTKPELAIRLVGWADAAHLQISDPRPSIEQADVDKIIAACIAKMGEVAFSDAYDEGQKMTMDEAVALALGTN